MVAGRAACGNKLTGNSHDKLLCYLNSRVCWKLLTRVTIDGLWRYMLSHTLLSSYMTLYSYKTVIIYHNYVTNISECHSYVISTAGATYGHIYLHFIKFNKWKMVRCSICLLEWWQLASWNFHGLVNGTRRVWKSDFCYSASNSKLLSFDWFDTFWWCYSWLCYSNKTFKGGN